MVKGKEPEGKRQGGEEPTTAGFCDIKEDIIKGIGNTLPSLKRFFQTLSLPVWSFNATLNIIKTAQESDSLEPQWLIINNHLVEEFNRRYNTVM